MGRTCEAASQEGEPAISRAKQGGGGFCGALLCELQAPSGGRWMSYLTAGQSNSLPEALIEIQWLDLEQWLCGAGAVRKWPMSKGRSPSKTAGAGMAAPQCWACD